MSKSPVYKSNVNGNLYIQIGCEDNDPRVTHGLFVDANDVDTSVSIAKKDLTFIGYDVDVL